MKLEKLLLDMLNEDDAFNDITSKLIPNVKIKAIIKSNEVCILSGIIFAEKLFKLMDKRTKIKKLKNDGEKVKKEAILEILGYAKSILPVERTALNILSHLSGVATKTAEFVNKSKVPVYDTRKTHPLLRYFEKYAVRCGGGFNHRYSLSDKLLIKDNHLKITKDIPIGAYEVEIQTIGQIDEVCKKKPKWIMLDNMDYETLKKSIQYIRDKYPKIKIEVSGGININNIKKISNLMPDRISTSKIIMDANSIDFSLDVLEVI